MHRLLDRLPGPRVLVWLVPLLMTLPFWIEPVGLYQYLGIEILIWCIYGLGYNLALGYTGMPSFGHGAFFGIGAYGMAIYQLEFSGSNLWVGLAAAVAAGGLAGALVGAFISHTRGIYLSLMTIAFGQVFWFSAIRLRGLTNGEDGLLNLQRLPADFGAFSIDLQSAVSLYYFTAVAFLVALVAIWVLIRSPFGSIIQATRQNERRTRFVGYNAHAYKWASFSLSAAITALAGGLFALAQQSAFPDVMSLHLSGIIVMMTIVGGGLVSYWGPILGVIFYYLTRDVIGAYTDTWLLWFGLAFVLVMLFQPEGIAGMLQRIRRRPASRAPDPLDDSGEAGEPGGSGGLPAGSVDVVSPLEVERA
jgi:branched-chain amino acid transport system permease protein